MIELESWQDELCRKIDDAPVQQQILAGGGLIAVTHLRQVTMDGRPGGDHGITLMATGRVNGSAIGPHEAGTILVEAVDAIRPPPEPNMSRCAPADPVTTRWHLAWRDHPWNHLPRRDGTWEDIVDAQGNSLFPPVDFTELFGVPKVDGQGGSGGTWRDRPALL